MFTGKCDELKYLCSNHYTFYTYLYWTILTFTYTIFLSYLTVDKQLKHKLYCCLLSLYIYVICTPTIHIWSYMTVALQFNKNVKIYLLYHLQ